MAKLSARGHRVIAQWFKTSADGQTTWHYALRSDGALLRRVTSKYVPTYQLGDREPVKGRPVTDSGHWTITKRHKWTADAPQSATLAFYNERMAQQGYMEVPVK